MTAPRCSRSTLLRRLAALRTEEAELLLELADLDIAEPATTYSSLDLPRGVTRRAFRERCRSGAVRGAEREGRVWTCSRDAWHSRRVAPVLRMVAPREADDAAIAGAAIAAAGLRASRRTG